MTPPDYILERRGITRAIVRIFSLQRMGYRITTRKKTLS